MGAVGAGAAGDLCAVFSQAQAAAARGAQHVSVDQGRSRTCTSTACGSGCGRICCCSCSCCWWRWRSSRCCGRVGKASRSTGERFIFLVDSSASMSATDVDGGTRLEAAKKRVGGLIDQMESDMSAMIISFADEPRVVQEFTDNRRLLREALARSSRRPSRRTSAAPWNWPAGSRIPSGSSIEEGGAEVDVAEHEAVELYIFSDGRFDAVEGFSLGNLEAEVSADRHARGQQSGDHGVQRAPQREPPGGAAGVRAGREFQRRRRRRRSCRAGARRRAARRQARSRSRRATSVGDDVRPGRRRRPASSRRGCRPPDEFGDRLALDNVAYAVLDQQKQTRVLLVTPGNRALELALSTERTRAAGQGREGGARRDSTRPSSNSEMQSETYDLVIFDQCARRSPSRCRRPIRCSSAGCRRWRVGRRSRRPKP